MAEAGDDKVWQRNADRRDRHERHVGQRSTRDRRDDAGGQADTVFEGRLRPARMEEFVGQEDVVATLRLALQAAAGRGDHARRHAAR